LLIKSAFAFVVPAGHVYGGNPHTRGCDCIVQVILSKTEMVFRCCRSRYGGGSFVSSWHEVTFFYP